MAAKLPMAAHWKNVEPPLIQSSVDGGLNDRLD